MAGILFTDGTMCLAGYNQHRFCISGIGGKAKDGELVYQTAVRETLEELFELEEIPDACMSIICSSLKFNTVMSVPNYSTFIMSFNDLDKILLFVRMFQVKSRVYSEIPGTITELLLNRKTHENAEFSHLALLPCTYNLALDRHLLNDIYAFKNVKNTLNI